MSEEMNISKNYPELVATQREQISKLQERVRELEKENAGLSLCHKLADETLGAKAVWVTKKKWDSMQAKCEGLVGALKKITTQDCMDKCVCDRIAQEAINQYEGEK